MDVYSSGLQGCTFEGKAYPDGTELCTIDLCRRCEGGEFKIPPEQSLAEENMLVDPAESYFVPI